MTNILNKTKKKDNNISSSSVNRQEGLSRIQSKTRTKTNEGQSEKNLLDFIIVTLACVEGQIV